MIPDNKLLRQFNQSVRRELRYHLWIKQHCLRNRRQWSALRDKALRWADPPVIGIVTPVYNTGPEVLRECIVSVLTQAYPHWHWLLVDDGSTAAETKAVLASDLCAEPRIEVVCQRQRRGISAATNAGIERIEAEYVLFLDHDDRLAAEALYYIAREIARRPEPDIVYADRDMLSPQGRRCMHLFKPDWSPETLLSGNYVFHPMCYRRRLLEQLGGLRSEFDGSQDYDLVLRAAETQPLVRHIPRVLYHWRQHEQSVALAPQAKEYAFAAGIRALNEALQRRGIKGKAGEIADLWRGNYQLQLDRPEPSAIEVIRVAVQQGGSGYASAVRDTLLGASGRPFIAIVGDALQPLSHETIADLAAWLQLQDVGLVSGKIVNNRGQIDYCGMIFKKDGTLTIPYHGYPESEPGYMAVTRITRNISAPHPYCVVFRRELWQQLGGFDPQYCGYYALLDFVQRAMAAGRRCLVVPQCRFVTDQENLLQNYPRQDLQNFARRWAVRLQQGDPYYNINLSENSAAMALSERTNSGPVSGAALYLLFGVRELWQKYRVRLASYGLLICSTLLYLGRRKG